MARPKGFEPLTPRFVVWCSIQLSYGRAGPLPGRPADGRCRHPQTKPLPNEDAGEKQAGAGENFALSAGGPTRPPRCADAATAQRKPAGGGRGAGRNVAVAGGARRRPAAMAPRTPGLTVRSRRSNGRLAPAMDSPIDRRATPAATGPSGCGSRDRCRASWIGRAEQRVSPACPGARQWPLKSGGGWSGAPRRAGPAGRES